MSFVSGPVIVRVPASTANLGPGFDCLGLALAMYDELTAEVVADGLRIDVDGQGSLDVARDESHLVVKSMNAAFSFLGVRPPGLEIHCRNVIPHGRGLGSSSAAIVGGLLLARALTDDGGDRLSDHTVYQLANTLEGHPDNVAAALFGGLTIAWLDGQTAAVVRRNVTTRVTAFVPPHSLPTDVARGLLPESVSHRDAAANAGRAALLIAALDGAPQHLLAATDDLLHQSYRSSAMPDSDALLRRMRSAGIPTIISGAGPTVLAFDVGLGAWAPEGWRAEELEIDGSGACILRTSAQI